MSRVGVAPAVLLTTFSLWGYACIISGDKCDENQVHVDEEQLDYCACAPGTIRDPAARGIRSLVQGLVTVAG